MDVRADSLPGLPKQLLPALTCACVGHTGGACGIFSAAHTASTVRGPMMPSAATPTLRCICLIRSFTAVGWLRVRVQAPGAAVEYPAHAALPRFERRRPIGHVPAAENQHKQST